VTWLPPVPWKLIKYVFDRVLHDAASETEKKIEAQLRPLLLSSWARPVAYHFSELREKVKEVPFIYENLPREEILHNFVEADIQTLKLWVVSVC
jgi:hypothetical protein